MAKKGKPIHEGPVTALKAVRYAVRRHELDAGQPIRVLLARLTDDVLAAQLGDLHEATDGYAGGDDDVS